MRIALRTGGGRGVYELAGRQGDLNASALFDHNISYEFTPGIVLPGRAMASRRQGKPRIKLDEKKRTTHFYRLLAGVLLLPTPIREFKMTHGGKLLRLNEYSMTAIKVDVSGITRENVILRPTDLLLETADNKRIEVEFAERMTRITHLWEAASAQGTQLAHLLKNHMMLVMEIDPDHKAIERCAQDISDLLKTEDDPLPLAEEQLGMVDIQAQQLPLSVPAQFTHQADFGMDDKVSPQEARIERVKQWRKIAVRGNAGRKFRSDIADSYSFRCAFSGQRLPKTDVTESAGVDAAHILPWSTHDINSINNGLCLSKQCHWAFDEGIIKLTYDSQCNSYVLDIPKAVRKAAVKARFDLEFFEHLVGPIPKSRLPANQGHWPSPKYLDALNQFVFKEII